MEFEGVLDLFRNSGNVGKAGSKFMVLFVCLFVCLLGCLFVGVCLFVCLFVFDSFYLLSFNFSILLYI